MSSEELDLQRFETIGVIKNCPTFEKDKLDFFLEQIDEMKRDSTWEKAELVELFNYMIPDFRHKETGKYLDGRM